MTIKYNSAELKSLAIHKVGNKNNDESLSLSKSETSLQDDDNLVLSNHFLSAFKQPEFFQFFHETELELNEVYVYAGKIFDNPEELYEQSRNLAMHLYRQTMHPKIKAGEFYTAYFEGIEVDGVLTEAVGLFKSENKDLFMKVEEKNDNFEINFDSGISLKKPDKGCMIYNVQREDGYLVSVIDNSSKGNEAMYWIDDFLRVENRKDDYFQTKNVMTLCKTYVAEQMPVKYEISKAEQSELLNKSMKFFKENEKFDVNMFADEVMNHPEIIEDFKSFKSDFEKENAMEIHDNFSISDSAVKKQSKFFKSIIKLDKNFHIYVHGNNKYLEKGFDSSTGMNFYKLFFENEE
jgi:hypothetical protein